MLEQAIRTKLIATSAVSALVGTTSATARIWVGRMTQNPTLPGIVLTRIGGNREYVMEGQSGATPMLLQLDVIDNRAQTTMQLAEAVRGALSAFKGTVGSDCILGCYLDNERMITDDGPELFRAVQTWTIWIQES